MEGPSLVILKEELKSFKGKKVLAVSGVSKIDQQRLAGQKIIDFKSWGKHFLIVFRNFTVRIHFLMFGSYRIDERKTNRLMLGLSFADNRELNFYTCAVKMIEDDLIDVYDWSTDVMSDDWDAIKARRKLRKQPQNTVSDVLLDQDIFSGVGNIIKNEVLFRIHVHPETLVGALPPRKLTEMVTQAREYSFDFYRWKKIFELRKHWLIYTKRKCPVCKIPVSKKPTGKGKRRSFFCEQCQTLYPLKTESIARKRKEN
jgi:endonuclease-8